ncbi:MAG TPA: type II toxin-antitoxin system HicA family toxin [bacterium]
MSHKKYPILKLKEVLAILSALGFSEIRSEGSHHHYMAIINDQKRVVTVDHGKIEFDAFLIKSMIAQSGLSREEFYGATKGTAKKIR